MKKISFIFLILFAFCGFAKSQYRLEFGGFYGGNFYLGDANPTIPFRNIKQSYGGLLRVNLDSRYSVKLHGYYGTLATQIDKFSNVPEGVPAFSINNPLWDLGIHFEYNFFPMNSDSYGVVYHASPYLFAGSGLTILNSTPMPNMSFGLGVKWKVLEIVTLGAEWGLRKMFSDKLDAVILNNPYGLNDSGMINNDYYSSFGIFATISLWKYKWKCGSNYMYY